MTEIDKTTVEDTAESADCAAAAENEVAADAGAESADGAVSEDAQAEQGKFAAAFGKGKAFMTRHGNIWQIVKFTLISLIAFLAEFASMYALQYGLEGVLGNEDFHWFIFHYAAE